MPQYTFNDSPPGHLSSAPREQVQAAMAAMHEEGGSSSSAAVRASKHAEKTKSAGAHRKAAAAHEKAAEHHHEEGNKKLGNHHEAMAAHHTQQAKKMTRNSVIDRLIKNNASNPKLVAILNAEKKDDGDDDDDEDDDDDDDEEGGERNASSCDWQASGGGKGMQAGGAGTKDEYNKTGVKNRARLSQEDQEVLNFGRQEMERQKLSVVHHLLVNVSNPAERNQFGNELMKLPMGELHKRLRLMGPTANRQQPAPQQDPVYNFGGPMFGGASGASPAFNSGGGRDDDDILPLPTINFSEWAEEDRKAKA